MKGGEESRFNQLFLGLRLPAILGGCALYIWGVMTYEFVGFWGSDSP